MPEWITATMEIVSLGLTFFCVLLLLVVWQEIRTHRADRADRAKGGGLVLRNWSKEPYGSIPDEDSAGKP